MEGLTICTWVWGKKYPRYYVDRLMNGLKKHVRQPFKFAIFTPQEEDLHLTEVKGCFARLRMFDPVWQQDNRIEGRLVCLDLDVVITGGLDPLFDRSEEFVILHGGNSTNPCPYNGSMMLLRTGTRPDVWEDFSVEEARVKVNVFEFPDDQGWLAYKIPGAAGWKVGQDGVYCFQKPGWPPGKDLPKDARIVAFPGYKDPSMFMHLPWVRENWL